MVSTKDESIQKSLAIEIDVVGMIRRRWTHILFGSAIGIVLSLMYHFSATRMYESNVEILVGQRSSELTNRGTITSATPSSEGIGEDQLATHMRVLVARNVLAKAIKKGALGELQSFRDAKDNGQSLVDHIVENIEVERGGKGSAKDAMVLRVCYRASVAADTVKVLTAVFESYKEYINSQDQDSSKLAVELIEAARETHERELVQADLEYRAYVASVPVLLEGDKVRDVHKDRLADMEAELNQVRSSLAESTSRLQVIETAMKKMDGRSLREIDQLALLSQKEVERLKFFLDMTRGDVYSEAFQAAQPMREEVARAHYNRLLDLIQKEKALSDTFGNGHPLVEAARKEVEITRLFMQENSPEATQPTNTQLDVAEMLSTYVMLLRNDIAELEKRKSILLEESTREMKLAKEVEADFMKAHALRAKMERAQARYNQVIERLQELNLARSYAGFSTDLLANAEVPRSPVWPRLSIVLILGWGAGLALGMMLALTAEALDSTFTNVRELEQALLAPVIAHVPRFHPDKQLDQVDPSSPLDSSLVAYHAPRSAESEVYRVARTSLMIASRKGSVKSMMMTSPQPGDGKSTTISNLAISFARTGMNVLLVDSDMRRPVISGLFGLDRRCGLADVLVGEATMEQAIAKSDIPGLDIMPNGMPTSQPAELLESHCLARMLQSAGRVYDLVLIDAPPLLAVADPAIIAPLVDAVILTVRINKNGRRPVEHASRILRDIDVKPSAVIVNGVDGDAKVSYGYGSYSRDQYGYVGHYHDRYAASDVDEEQDRRIIQPPHKPHMGQAGQHAVPGLGLRTDTGSIPTSPTPISR